MLWCVLVLLFFFNDTATTEIYTLSLHDALPILWRHEARRVLRRGDGMLLRETRGAPEATSGALSRSEEHTSELQSQSNLVCRLLLEKKKKQPRRKRTLLRQLRTARNRC